MVFVVLTVVVGVAVGYLGGGRLRRLAAVSLTRVELLVAAVAAQAVLTGLTTAGVRTGTAGTALLLGSYIGLIAFVWANRALPGMVLVALGSGLNAVVVAANGAMPVSRTAIATVTSDPVDIVAGKHRLLEAGDRLPWLADVIPVPVLRQIISVGDIVLAVGVAVLVGSLMLPRGRHAGRRRAAVARDRSGEDRSSA